ncbi:MAG: APC family permease [Micropruina sp.]
MTIDDQGNPTKHIPLARDLSFGDVVRLSLSSITPASAVFAILPSTIVALYWGSALSIVAAILMCVPIAYCYAMLGRAFPGAGGEYSFAARFFGRSVGQAAWLTTVAGVTLAIATILQGAGALLGAIVGIDLGVWAVPLLVLVPLLISPQRVLRGARITSVLLIIELIALAAISSLGIYVFASSGTTLTSCVASAVSSVALLDPALILAGVSVAYFALAGFGSAIILGEEDEDFGRASARAVGWSLVLAGLLELGAVIAVLLGLGCSPAFAGIDGGGAGQLLSQFPLIGDSLPLRLIVLGGGFIAAINAVVVITMQVARIVFSGARDSYLPSGVGEVLARVNPATQTPIPATLLVIVVAASIGALVPVTSVVAWASAALFVPPAVVAASMLVWNRSVARSTRGRWTPRDLIPLSALIAMGVVAYFVLSTDPGAVVVAVAAWIAGLINARLTRPRTPAVSLHGDLGGSATEGRQRPADDSTELH